MVPLLSTVLLTAGCVEDPADWKSRGISSTVQISLKKQFWYMTRLLKIDPADPMVWNNRGYAFYQLNRYDEAVQSCDSTLSDRSCVC